MRKYRFISQRQLRYISSQTFITASIRSQPGALERVLLVEIDKDADLQKLKMEADRKANNKTMVNEKAQKVLSGKKWVYIDESKNPIDIKKEIEKVKEALKGAEDFSVIVSPHYAFRNLEMINSWYVQGGGSERDLADTYIGWEKQRA
ncbi:MAG: hypothetical protein OIF32_06305 [Campylobacterales bacterium]|nr:hypothetical protein [Campylobacterales bacterium]